MKIVTESDTALSEKILNLKFSILKYFWASFPIMPTDNTRIFSNKQYSLQFINFEAVKAYYFIIYLF